MQQNPLIQFEKVSQSYSEVSVLKELSFEVFDSEVFVIIGSSGSGKTTCLKLINGLLSPNSGQIYYKGTSMDQIDPIKHRRSMGFAIQGSGLFPHMSVIDNLSVVARLEGWSRNKINLRAEELLDTVNLEPGSVWFKRPDQLSGGQQQRVGIVRALFMAPEVLLMDEAFGALDPITRRDIQGEFLRLQKKMKFTSIIVTHDLSEAFRLGSRICLLNSGSVEQIGPPSEILLKPRSSHVEEFVTTHSPGSLLQDILIQSVIDVEVLVTSENEDGSYSARRLLDTENLVHSINLSELRDLHQRNRQIFFYFCNENSRLIKTQTLEEQGNVLDRDDFYLTTQDSFLSGLKTLLACPYSQLPVVNEEGILCGGFSEKSIRAL